MDCVLISGRDLLGRTVRIPSPPRARVVLVGGCFDVLHLGHITFLKRAKMQGDYLVVALESDDFILSRKKRRPFHSQLQRAKILASIRSVDCVITLPQMRDDASYQTLVETIQPHVIAITRGDALADRKREYARLVGARVVAVNSLIAQLSSSTITTYARIVHD